MQSQRRLVGLAPVAAVATASVSYAYMAGTTLRLEDHDNQRKVGKQKEGKDHADG